MYVCPEIELTSLDLTRLNSLSSYLPPGVCTAAAVLCRQMMSHCSDMYTCSSAPLAMLLWCPHFTCIALYVCVQTRSSELSFAQ